MPSQAGSLGVNQPGPTLLTAQAVSDIVREAVGGVKNYIDEAMNVQKKESDKVLESTSISNLETVKEIITGPVPLQREQDSIWVQCSNRRITLEASACLVDGKAILAKEIVDKAVTDLKKRNKLIPLADKSDAGFSPAVDEYLSDELASNSEDEKRIGSAQARAVAKKRKSKPSRPKPNAGRRQNVAEAPPNPNYDNFFPRYPQQSRFPFTTADQVRDPLICASAVEKQATGGKIGQVPVVETNQPLVIPKMSAPNSGKEGKSIRMQNCVCF